MNNFKKILIGGLTALIISTGCYKKAEKIEPFIGTIIGEGTYYSDMWSIYVSDLENKEAKLFKYYFSYRNYSSLKALDDAFNKGDIVIIERWSNGKYSYPKPYKSK